MGRSKLLANYNIFKDRIWILVLCTVFLTPFMAVDLRGDNMTKKELVQKIQELLNTDIDLNFLLKLQKKEIETLIACIRDRVDQK